MSLQEMNIHKSTLFFLGAFKALEYVEAIQNNITTVMGPYFNDPASDWQGIDRILSAFGTSKMMSHSGFSKDPDQGDGSKNPWTFAGAGNGDIVKIYTLMNDAGYLQDDSLAVTLTASPSAEETVAFGVWSQILKGYEGARELMTGLHTLLYAVSELAGVNTHGADDYLQRSPQQLQLYSSYKCATGLASDSRYGDCSGAVAYDLYPVPEDTVSINLPGIYEFIRTGNWMDIFTAVSDAGKQFTYSESETAFTVSAADIEAGRKSIVGMAGVLVHPIYIMILPEVVDDIEIPSCYGVDFGTPADGVGLDCDLVYPDDTGACPYAGSCGGPGYANRALMVSSTEISTAATAEGGYRMRYKTIMELI